MKNAVRLLTLALMLGTAACSSSTDPGDSSVGVKAKVNGASWNAQGVSSLPGYNGVSFMATLDITNLSNLESISIDVDTAFVGATLPLGGDDAFPPANYAEYKKGNDEYATPESVSTGTLKITDVSGGRVKGTFSFTAYKGGVVGNDSVVVTDGTFDVSR